MILIPLRLGAGLNDRLHWRARARKVKKEREAVAWSLVGQQKPATPCVVTITRVAPSNGVDSDNLQGAAKGVRDQIAYWLGVDDRDSKTVLYLYRQKRGPWGVEISFESD